MRLQVFLDKQYFALGAAGLNSSNPVVPVSTAIRVQAYCA
jgi:hypothetical protein